MFNIMLSVSLSSPFPQEEKLKHLILYEVKKEVDYHIHNAKAKDIAQTFVEGYYTLIGQQTTSIVIALTSVAVTHYFLVKLPRA